MNKEELAKLLRATFQQELRDHVGSLTRELLAMESDLSTDLRAESWQVILRIAHTLKGASAVVNINSIRDTCHSMEDIFGHYRDQSIAMPEEVTSLMLKTVDGFSEIGDQLQSDSELDESTLADILPELKRLADQMRLGDKELPSERDRPKPRPEDEGQQPDEEPPAREPSVETGSVEKPIATRPTAGLAASVRVSAQKLDSLLSHSGELLIARGRMALRLKDANELSEFADDLRLQWKSLEHGLRHPASTSRQLQEQGDLVEDTGEKISALTKRLDRLSTGMKSDDRLLNQTCGRLDDEVYRVRMLPFAEACVGLDRVVRDVAKSSGKLVRLRIEGADVEVDRSVLEGLKDPLLHLIRNAVDHGVELPQERLERGKPEQATVTVSASLRGGQVEVRVEDDGGGFDLDRICKIGKKRGLEIPDDPRQQVRLVLNPGFSTATIVTDISGRGIGMDVVQNRVESLHGELNIGFEAGQWTRFVLTVPLTLTTIRCVQVRAGGQRFAIPTVAIDRLARFTAADVRSVAGRDTLFVQGSPVPLVQLTDALGLKSTISRPNESGNAIAMVLSADDRRVATVVDEVLSEQEVLVKNLGPRIRRLKHFSGCTLLPSGRIALVINAANVVRSALEDRSRQLAIQSSAQDRRLAKRILLADDSVTTRILLKNILETAGYVVVDAVDGQQAWSLLQQSAGEAQQSFDAVVSDVDMPRMNGFELTSRLRNNEQTAEIPVVLVTARGTDDDKREGVKVGASAYIVKGSFDQQSLLRTLTQLV